MGAFTWLRRRGPSRPSRADVSRCASMSMAIHGLADLGPSDFCAVIAIAIAARVDVPAADLDDLSNKIGRMAHAEARRASNQDGGKHAD